jgi:hypothetical protein
MVKSTEIKESENVFSKFPGPITLVPSRRKWWNLTSSAGFFTILGLSFSFRGDTVAILATTLFGICTVMGVITLLPGASFLRLDENGFDITRFFRKQIFRWSEVSDFGVWTFRGKGLVVFKAEKSRLNISEKINAALAGGRNGYLPDTYGSTAEDLVQLMTAWRNSATDASK